MKISALKAQVKSPERVSLYVDGKFYCGLNLGQVLEFKLRVGLELDDRLLENLKQESDYGKLKSNSLDWLLRRPHSLREFTDYLKRKKVDQLYRDRLVKDLAKYINEEEFARFWVNSRRNSKNRSARSITSELLSKGVSREVIEDALNDNEISDAENLQNLIAKKQKLVRYKDTTKLKQYLLRQGFSYDDIKKYLS